MALTRRLAVLIHRRPGADRNDKADDRDDREGDDSHKAKPHQQCVKQAELQKLLHKGQPKHQPNQCRRYHQNGHQDVALRRPTRGVQHGDGAEDRAEIDGQDHYEEGHVHGVVP